MRTLIESSFGLTTKMLKRELKKARQNEPVESGFVNFKYNGRPSVLDYSIEKSFDGNNYLVIRFESEPQKILLSEHNLTFGARTYLTCACGAKTNALYLKLGYFACRTCQGLHYQSNSINPNSEHGMFLYLQARRLKLINMRAEMGRIFYRSGYTKRFLKWSKLCVQAGLISYVHEAEKLTKDINDFKFASKFR